MVPRFKFNITQQNCFLLIFSLLIIFLSFAINHRVVPVYDGVGFPDEPYRYVNPPSAELQTVYPPTSAQDAAPIVDGKNNKFLSLASTDLGPQIVVYLARHSLSAVSSINSITVHANPQAFQGHQPSDGKIAGNVYDVTSDQPVVFADSSKTSTINLRLPQAVVKPNVAVAIEHRQDKNSDWQHLDTTQVGNDIYQTAFVGFGDYAAIVLTSNSSKPKCSNDILGPFCRNPALSVAAVITAIFIITVVFVTMRIRIANSKG